MGISIMKNVFIDEKSQNKVWIDTYCIRTHFCCREVIFLPVEDTRQHLLINDNLYTSTDVS